MKQEKILETADMLLRLSDSGEWKEFLLHVLDEGREGQAFYGRVSVLAVLETEMQKKCPEPEALKMVHYIIFHEVEKAFGKKAECRQITREEDDVLYLVLRHELEGEQVEHKLGQALAALQLKLGFGCRIALCHKKWEEAQTGAYCQEMGKLLREGALLPEAGLIHEEDAEVFLDISYEPDPEEVKLLLGLFRPSPSREEALERFAREKIEAFSRNRFSHRSVCKALERLIWAAFLEVDEDLWEQSGKRLAGESQEKLKHCRTMGEFQEVYTGCLLEFAWGLEKANLSEGMKIVSRMKSRIRTEYSQNLKLSAFAAEYYMNQSYLSVLFRQETGKSFSQYLTEVRLQKARELLETTVLPTRKIAELVGYNDRNYFAAVFSKHEGKTPMQYRKDRKT